MHLYWKVIEELRYLGEVWIIHDPSVARSYTNWINKNLENIKLYNIYD